MNRKQEPKNLKSREEAICKLKYHSLGTKSSSSPTSSPLKHDQPTLQQEYSSSNFHNGESRPNQFTSRSNTRQSENLKKRDPFLLTNRQRNFSSSSRFKGDIYGNGSKENVRQRFINSGSISMRYYREISPFLDETYSSISSPDSNPDFIPGRFSCDDRQLISSRKTNHHHHQRSNSVDNIEQESSISDNYSNRELSCAESNSTASSRVSSSRRLGKDVSSRFLLDVFKRSKSLNSEKTTHLSLQKPPPTMMSSVKKSSWALSPGRSALPPSSRETKQRTLSFSNLKPPLLASNSSDHNPAKGKRVGVGKLLMGLFKGSKSNNNNNSSLPPPLPSLMHEPGESVHLFKVMHNRLVQWQFVNSKSKAVKGKTTKKVENELVLVMETLNDLRLSVMRKRIQLDKEKLEMKLKYFLQAQLTSLESWDILKNQHLVALSMMEKNLHAAVCRVPIKDGAMVDPQALSVSLHHACYLMTSIMSTLANFLDQVTYLAPLISELAIVVSSEGSLLEECIELNQSIERLEIEEWSLRCCVTQFQVQKHQDLLGPSQTK